MLQVPYSCSPAATHESSGSGQRRWPAVILFALQIPVPCSVDLGGATHLHAYSVFYRSLRQAQVGTVKDEMTRLCLFL